MKTSFKSKATDYGIRSESKVRDYYMMTMNEDNHEDLKISMKELVICLKDPRFAASPDSYVDCGCCGPGCVELKCPYRMEKKDLDINQFAQLKDSCLEYTVNTFTTVTFTKTPPYY